MDSLSAYATSFLIKVWPVILLSLASGIILIIPFSSITGLFNCVYSIVNRKKISRQPAIMAGLSVVYPLGLHANMAGFIHYRSILAEDIVMTWYISALLALLLAYILGSMWLYKNATAQTRQDKIIMNVARSQIWASIAFPVLVYLCFGIF